MRIVAVVESPGLPTARPSACPLARSLDLQSGRIHSIRRAHATAEVRACRERSGQSVCLSVGTFHRLDVARRHDASQRVAAWPRGSARCSAPLLRLTARPRYSDDIG